MTSPDDDRHKDDADNPMNFYLGISPDSPPPTPSHTKVADPGKSKAKLVLVIIIVVIAIAVIAYLANGPFQAERKVEATASDVLATCMQTLPYGTNDCDESMTLLQNSCIENNEKFNFCRDPRMETYITTVYETYR